MNKKINQALNLISDEGLTALLKSTISYIRWRGSPSDGVQFHYKTKLRHRVQQLQYKAPAHPYKMIYVDPSEIEYYCPSIPHKSGLSQILDDHSKHFEHRLPIENHWIFRGLTERFVENKEWEATEYYGVAEKKFENNDSFWGYDSLNQFKKERLHFNELLYNSIKESGYLPNYRGKHNVPKNDKRQTQLKYRDSLEPLVGIGKCGEIYWRNGFHRFTIARILDVGEIPVNVLARHEQWQKTRDHVYENTYSTSPENVDNHHDHPDMMDIVQI
ncbi:hypothetical protein [Natrarchaeobius halalkaliphilus]|uniref:hypothetical protein n=1 Tax=Natrarchaeobius halalkaliphilus TaxID=1679091 RepID=UPI000F521CC8|nr:hypothetical protein [Natrarchaeobius halalkaliphilus]